jgi:outer membrane protein assembly factor BamB
MIRLLPVVLFSAIISFAADWPTFRGNMQRTGYYSEPAGIPKKKPLWVANIGSALVSSPAVADNTLYIGGRDSCLYAIEAGTGKVLWKKETEGWVDSSPLLNDGKIFVGSRDGTIYAFDPNGNESLQMEAGLQLSSPAMMSNGMVITGMGPPYNGLSVFRPEKSMGMSKTIPEWSITFDQMSYSSPAVLGQAVVLGASDSKLYMIDAGAGAIRWSLKTEGGVYLSSPAIDKETARVYFAPGNSDRNIYAVDLLTGKTLWKNEGAPNKSLNKKLSEAAIPPETMMELLRFKPEYRQKIISQLLKKTGRQSGLAKKASGNALDSWIPLGDMKTSSVAIAPDMVYVIQKALGLQERQISGVNDQVYMPKFTLLALDKDSGQEVWRFSEMRSCIKLGYCSSPVVTKQSVIFGWGEGMVYALDRKTGALQWSDTLAGDIISSPAIANGNLYVATMEGNLYCYNLSGTSAGLDFQRSTYCYPNPARKGVSHIQVYVQREAALDMTVYNITERPVFRETRRLSADDKFTYNWDLKNVANGVYFARIVVKYNDGGTDKKVLKIAVLK